MDDVRSMGVYKHCQRSEMKPGGKLANTRWVDVNKGTGDEPKHRSRLVTIEFNTDKTDELYAPTPPLSAFRWLVSRAATVDKSGPGGGRTRL